MNNKLFLNIFILTLLIITILFNLSSFSLASEPTAYVWDNQSKKIDFTKETNAVPLTNEETITKNSLNLDSESACLIEQSSGLVIYNHNMHERLRPASVTKVMSILLFMEALDSGRISLTDRVPCTDDASAMGGSQIWLDKREELTVDEMLKAICIVSANDCTVQNQQENINTFL